MRLTDRVQRLIASSAGASLTLAHDAGAVAFINNRGREINTRSDIAILLLQAVHSQVVGVRYFKYHLSHSK